MNNSSTYIGIIVDVLSVVVPVVGHCIRCKLNVGCMMKANLQTVLLGMIFLIIMVMISILPMEKQSYVSTLSSC